MQTLSHHIILHIPQGVAPRQHHHLIGLGYRTALERGRGGHPVQKPISLEKRREELGQSKRLLRTNSDSEFSALA